MSDHVTVSMYNVGFGDCFLLRFPAQDRERKVLIDCGSMKLPTVDDHRVDIDEVVERIVRDVTEDDGPRIDVVAASHRHADHVSGFLNAAWDGVKVDEVWLPWTEDPNDPEAVRLLNEMSSFALALNSEFHALNAVNGLGEGESEFVSHVIENFFGIGPGDQENQNPLLSLKNEDAMGTLHRGFVGGPQGAKREFLRRVPAGQPYRTDCLPGVDIHLLGPSDDEDVITSMDPPREESFLRAGGRMTHEDVAWLPFTPWSPIDEELSSLDERLLGLLDRLSSDSAVLGAAALESSVNNTSLMLAFEVGDAVLLFPGDSQWGSWRINRDDGLYMDLLRRCTFYKVGHHGSHNASPRFFLDDERLGGLWGAAVSVTPHGRFTKIPKVELLDHLTGKLVDAGNAKRLVRSDQPPDPNMMPDQVEVVDTLRVDFKVPIRTDT